MKLQSKISDFLDNKLSNDDLIEFMEHIHICKECMKEVEINFILIEGFQELSKKSDLSDDFTLMFQEFVERKEIEIDKIYNIEFNKQLLFGMCFIISLLGIVSMIDGILEMFAY